MSKSDVALPRSNSTVRVRMIDTTALMTVRSETLIEPVPPGHEILNITDVAFLVEHEASGKKVLFDLGIRKDYWNFPAVLQKRLSTVIPGLLIDKDVSEILEDRGISLASISSIIWSHYHWDHTGNVSLFPKSTELIVGPGFKAAPHILPGYPIDSDAYVSASTFEGRTLTEIDFKASNLDIGGFPAFDFFGDGSFYILDTPGHCIGHICGLARTTPDPDSTFVFMGGDIAHFAGDFRPHPKIPFPDVIPEGVLDTDIANFPIPCSCSMFTEDHPMISSKMVAGDPKETPFYKVSSGPKSSHVKPATAQESVNTLKGFDVSPSVFVCLAHDGALLQHLPTLNKHPESDLNDWKAHGWKQKCHWGWLNELPRCGKPGRKPVVEGLWRDQKPWEEGRKILLEQGEKAAKGLGGL